MTDAASSPALPAAAAGVRRLSADHRTAAFGRRARYVMVAARTNDPTASVIEPFMALHASAAPAGWWGRPFRRCRSTPNSTPHGTRSRSDSGDHVSAATTPPATFTADPPRFEMRNDGATFDYRVDDQAHVATATAAGPVASLNNLTLFRNCPGSLDLAGLIARGPQADRGRAGGHPGLGLKTRPRLRTTCPRPPRLPRPTRRSGDRTPPARRHAPTI